jgi:hypothetical protein
MRVSEHGFRCSLEQNKEEGMAVLTGYSSRAGERRRQSLSSAQDQRRGPPVVGSHQEGVQVDCRGLAVCNTSYYKNPNHCH